MTVSSKDLKTRVESQFCGMCFPGRCRECAAAGHERDVARDFENLGARPAGLIEEHCAPGVTLVAISSRWSCVASPLQAGSTGAAPAM